MLGPTVLTEEILQNLLHQLSPEEQWDLCMDAKTHASLQGMEPGSNINPVEKREVVYLDGTTDKIVGLQCPTDPIIFLFMENSQNTGNIKILREDEFLSSYEFEMHAVKHIVGKFSS